jgi:gluconate 2-dehydrogenase gamma chain
MGGSRRIFLKQVGAAPCPADNLTPNRVDCGLATFIDRQLAGDFGRDDRLYPGPVPARQAAARLPASAHAEQFFKAGVGATQAACGRRFGTRGIYDPKQRAEIVDYVKALQ